MADKAPTLAEVEQESVHDSILASMADAVGETADDTPAPAGDTPAKQESDAEAKARQDRDERGRFKAKAGEEAAADKTADTAGDPDVTDDIRASLKPAAPAAEPDPIDPPNEWKAAEQDQFRSLPRPAQEFVLAKYNASREAEGRAAQTTGKYSALEQTLAPRRAALMRDGLDEVSYLQYLDRLSQSAAQDPRGFARWFAQQRGLTAEQIFGQPQQSQGQPQVADPYIANLNQQLGEFKNYIETQRRQTDQARTADLTGQIRSFETAADDKGKPLHPYFTELKPLMGSLMRDGQAADLQTAYEMASRAHPDVSAKIASAQRAQQERDRAVDQRKKAEAARKAGSSISGAPGDRSAAPPSGDIREDLRRQLTERGLL